MCFQNLPTEANLYSFVPRNDKDTFAKLAQSLGFEESEMDLSGKYDHYTASSKETFPYDDQNPDKEIHAFGLSFQSDTGAWDYRNNLYDSDVAHDLPSDDEAYKIAKDCLKKHGLFSEKLTDHKVVGQYAGGLDSGKSGYYCKTVYFYQTVDEKPVVGVSRYSVDVGENGEIVAIQCHMKDVIFAKTVQLVDPKTLAENLDNFSSNIDPAAVSATISEVKLAYYESPSPLAEQPYLQPVWAFVGKTVLSDGTVSEFDIIAPAIPAELTTPLPEKPSPAMTPAAPPS